MRGKSMGESIRVPWKSNKTAETERLASMLEPRRQGDTETEEPEERRVCVVFAVGEAPAPDVAPISRSAPTPVRRPALRSTGFVYTPAGPSIKWCSGLLSP